MGRLYLIQLEGRIYSCKSCHSHLANVEELLSKAFHCRHGRAYLFNTVVNVNVGPLEHRLMTTGMHVVGDIFCNCCGRNVGWKYEFASEKAQKYKEGKFILERELVLLGGRAKVVDGDGTDFYLDSHQASSDADDA